LTQLLNDKLRKSVLERAHRLLHTLGGKFHTSILLTVCLPETNQMVLLIFKETPKIQKSKWIFGEGEFICYQMPVLESPNEE
jgi:hypothetical protein